MDVKKFLLIAAAGLVVLIAAVAALGVGALVLENRAHDRLDAALSKPLAALLPDGQVEDVDVTDSPALLAGRRDRIQQTLLQGSTGGHDVLVIVREYDREAQRAESISWELGGIAFAPGWTNVRAADGAYTDRATATVDGHDYEVTASADLEADGDETAVVVQVGALTADGEPLPLGGAPAAVRTALAPVSFPVPDPRAGAEVRQVWFDEQGLGAEMYARDADARRA